MFRTQELDPELAIVPAIISLPSPTAGVRTKYNSKERSCTYPISPVAGVVAIRLAVEFVHCVCCPLACAWGTYQRIGNGGQAGSCVESEVEVDADEADQVGCTEEPK